jgi:hypothetical protein
MQNSGWLPIAMATERKKLKISSFKKPIELEFRYLA